MNPQIVTDGSVNLMVNKVSGPVVENKDVGCLLHTRMTAKLSLSIP